VTFDVEGLLAALQEAQLPEGIGFTTRELCEKTGRPDDWVRNELRRVEASGRLGTSKRRITCINGSKAVVTAYYLKAR
jgi:hypothetical protein